MTVFRSAEKIDETGNEKSVEQYEALTLGVAVQASAILNQESELLGGTIRDHLKRSNLLV
jgi:hypothetical protein